MRMSPVARRAAETEGTDCRRLGPSGRSVRSLRSEFAAPGLVIVLFITLIVSQYYNLKIFGYQVSGWGWFVVLVGSLLRLSANLRRIAFPVLIWLPWCVMVGLYGFSGYEFAWQSTSQIICPVIAGMAFSTYRVTARLTGLLDSIIRLAYIVFVIGYLIFILPDVLANLGSPFAAGAISALFFQSYFLARFLIAGKRTVDLLLYLSAVAIPAVAVHRGPLAASVALAVLALMPIGLSRRVGIAVLGLSIGLAVFYSPRFQRKMFLSGKGTLRDLRYDNPDLYMTGRKAMWESLLEGCEEKPWFGHGGNADRTWLLSRGFGNYLPHNDWLRIRFNYGWVGVALYVATMIAQVAHGRRKLLVGDPKARAIAAAGLSCFVPYAVVMFTDNVLIYCQFFTVPMMMLIGLSYSHASLLARRSRATKKARTRIFQPLPMAGQA